MFRIFLDFYHKVSIENLIQLISNISIIIALFTGIYFSVRSNNKLRKQNSILNIIELERDLMSSRRMLDNINFENSKISNSAKSQVFAHISLYEVEFKNYFNILDRICFCFLHKYIPEKEINKEYHNLIIKIYESEDYKIKPDENNNNLKKYYEKKVRGKNNII